MRAVIALRVNRNRAVSVVQHDSNGNTSAEPASQASATCELARLARAYPDAWIAWRDERVEPRLSNLSAWPTLPKHRLEILHVGAFARTDRAAVDLGHVDFDSWYFFEAPRTTRYATWLISAAAGIAHASVLSAVGVDESLDLGPALMDVGGRGIRYGVCPCSEPALVADHGRAEWSVQEDTPTAAARATLVRRLYGRHWVPFWFAASLCFDRAFHPFAAGKGWTASPPGPVDAAVLDALRPPIPAAGSLTPSVHVVVPTLARPKCVADLLGDLAAQTVVPRSVILVEQVPGAEGTSGLGHLTSRTWPFELRHHVVGWTGACRARNLGLASHPGTDWTLLLDDDVRLPSRFIGYALGAAEAYAADVVTAAIIEEHAGRREPSARPPRFGSYLPGGACLISRRALERAGPFDERLEHGWGEDTEYGIRLRVQGATILQAPGEPVVHLRAPVGGFRFRRPLPWDADSLKPRPAPTVLLTRRSLPIAQQRGYRLYYFLKRLADVPVYRMVMELPRAMRQWRCAAMWADRFARGAPRHAARS